MSFLQMIVGISYFSLYYHLINGNRSKDQGLVPMFLTYENPPRDIKELSRSTFVRARQQIEIGYENQLDIDLKEYFKQSQSTNDFYNNIENFLDKQILRERFREEFSRIRSNTDNEFKEIIQALSRTLLSEKSLQSHTTYIGKNCGLVFPRAQGAGEKYYLPNTRFLDQLVLSIIEPNEEITIDEFWDRAWDRYGMISGYFGTMDVEKLSAWGIRSVSPKKLQMNARKLLNKLIDMGHAKAYADGIAIVKGVT